MPHSRDNTLRPTYSNLLSLAVIIYVVALVLSIPTSSLWSDEAFSAYMACQKNLSTFKSTLLGGDSSDLQVWLYYLYLFFWVKLAGTSEIALRSSNIVFILLFSFTLTSSSWLLFRSRWCWIPIGFCPFIWHYAGEARAYFIILSLSTLCICCALAYLAKVSEKMQPAWPWIFLGALFLGSCFHMLMLLIVAPLATLSTCFLMGSSKLSCKYWVRPVCCFSPLFAALFVYLVFTFLRGTSYGYPHPKIISMAGVALDLSGLYLFGPNRKFSTDMHLYMVPIAASAAALSLSLGTLIWSGVTGKNRLPFFALSAALFVAVVQIAVLSVGLQKQIDARHCAAVLPFAFYWIESAICGGRRQRVVTCAAVGLAAIWCVADARGFFLPQYQRQDFKTIASQAINFQRQSGGDLMFVSDPLGAAYYGVSLKPDRPCFPLVADCATGLSSVKWKYRAVSSYGFYWKAPEINLWITEHRRNNKSAFVVLSQERPNATSPWWNSLDSLCNLQSARANGFSVCVIK